MLLCGALSGELTDSFCLTTTTQEVRWCGTCEVKVEGGADHLFGLENLLLGTRLVSDEDKVFQFRRVYLFELGGYEHTCHANQL